MPTQIHKVIQNLRSAVLRHDEGPTDGQLLGRYIEHRESDAVTALVRRHGPMVWGVCRRVLGNDHDADDAFQATFLVLVRKASSVRQREMVGNWLYGVAHQTARKAMAMRAKRQTREKQVKELPEIESPPQAPSHDLQPLLDQELSLLPDNYRIAIILCDLEGKTRKAVARQLGLPEGTLAGRLARGRALLAKRLARHGLDVSGAALAGILAQTAASASVPAAVMIPTIKAVASVAAGQTAAAGLLSAKVTALTEGVLKTMLLTKLMATVKVAMAILFVASAVALSWGVSAGQQQSGAPENAKAKSQTKPAEPLKNDNDAALREADAKVQRAEADVLVAQAFLAQAKVERDALRKSGAEKKDQKLKSDKEQLQGKWNLVEEVLDGKRASPIKSGSCTIKGTSLRLNTTFIKEIFRFKLDETTEPKLIDLVGWDTGIGAADKDGIKGIYSITGDTLRICIKAEADAVVLRPTDLESKAGSKYILWTFRRESPKDESKKDAKNSDARFPNGRHHDFDTVKPEATLKYDFGFVNTTGIRLQLSVTTSAGCVTGLLNKKVLQSGEEAKLAVTVDARKFTGPKTMLLFLTTQDGKSTETFRFTVAANSANSESPELPTSKKERTSIEWRTDYAQARKDAAEKKMLLLLWFHGPTPSADIAPDKETKALINEKFIPVKLDRENLVGKHMQIQSATVILADSDGRILFRIYDGEGKGYLEPIGTRILQAALDYDPAKAALLNHLGLVLEPVAAAEIAGIKKDFKNVNGGMRVLEVRPASPAYDAKLRKGDFLVGLQDWEIVDHQSVALAVEQLKKRPPESFRFVVIRGNQLLMGHYTPPPQVLPPPALPQDGGKDAKK